MTVTKGLCDPFKSKSEVRNICAGSSSEMQGILLPNSNFVLKVPAHIPSAEDQLYLHGSKVGADDIQN